MNSIQEGRIRIDFPGSIHTEKFDAGSHGLSHCMKAVDAIIEFADHYLFIEFKDPNQPGVASANRAEFLEKFKTGVLRKSLKEKFRDSFLYRWALEKVDKPIRYYVLVEFSTLDDASLLFLADQLKRELPCGKPKQWKRPIVESCQVFNVRTWKKHLKNYPISVNF